MIITNNEEALRVVCADVLTDEASSLIMTLENELAHANSLGRGGIGLAAPQIGIAKKIAIIRFDKFSINLINCKVDKGYDPVIFRDEGCLSFPGRSEDTTRFQETHIINNLIYPHSFITTGLLSVACQHEIDHYSNVLFMDHAIPKIKKKLKPNDICNCGSKLKYKRCCGK